ncbi:LysR family transcriptional regulator [Roseomonas sp. KE2513]|uniref:LysR family transcriptional regulator n=1 Tax=Roseomonas sp. KE2513 TaxID=2479202 RepID=UPI0035CAC6C7
MAEARSFTLAAQRLDLAQSTVSQHVKRLEALLGRTLFARNTHSVALTPDGDALLAFARQVLEAHERLERFFASSALRGRVRVGISEDFVLAGLQEVLAAFTRRHASVDLELTVGLSGRLYERFDAGELDVILAKRRRDDPRGRLAWREALVWIGRPGIHPDPAAPLPLLLYPPPSITRALALDALEKAGRSWRVACTSDSLSGLHAAAHAGLGVVPHAARLIPAGLAVLPTSRHLPDLSGVEFVVIAPAHLNNAGAALAEDLLRHGSAGW